MRSNEGMPGVLGPPGIPGSSDIYPTYGIVTFLLKVGDGRLQTVTRMIEMKYRDQSVAFLNSRGLELNHGEWESFYADLIYGRRNKAVKFVKDIIKEINDGWITVRGNKNAKKRV